MTDYQVYTPHPSLSQPVTDEQRTRAQNWLHAAYADGRLTASEYDERVGRVWLADDRAQLNAVFAGLISAPARPLAVASSSATVARPAATGTLLPALSHFLFLPTGPVGSGLIYLLSAKGSAARQEAARAFNFQLFAAILCGIAGMVFSHGALSSLQHVIWMVAAVASIVAGVRILKGAPRPSLVDQTPLHILKG